MATTYNWQQPDWPHFRYDAAALSSLIHEFAEKSGQAKGTLRVLPEGEQEAAILQMLIAEAIKTSEIEGEYLSRKDVYSSVQAALGVAGAPAHVADRRAVSISALVVDVRKTFAETLTAEMLWRWHTMLFKDSRSLDVIGNWRQGKGPMQVVSKREEVYFEAPPSERVPEEMDTFIRWFNDTAPGGAKAMSVAPIRAAITHLYFESIHPFEDGNGRIGRALAEKALAQVAGAPPVMSISAALEKGHAQYYLDLQTAQTGNEITGWIQQFISVLILAQDNAEEMIDFILRKAKFYDRHRAVLNERQAKAVERMMEEGPDGFEGGMNATKYMSITRASKATATRDLQDLLRAGAIERIGESGGRSTRYALNV